MDDLWQSHKLSSCISIDAAPKAIQVTAEAQKPINSTVTLPCSSNNFEIAIASLTEPPQELILQRTFLPLFLFKCHLILVRCHP